MSMFGRHMSAAKAAPKVDNVATENLELVNQEETPATPELDPLTGEPMAPEPNEETPAPSETPAVAENEEMNVEEVEDVIIPEDDETVDDDTLAEDLEADEKEIEQLETEMRQMIEASVAIENFGINKSTVAVMQITGLLSGTALETIGLESYGNHMGSDPESQLAIESLGEKIKEKSAAWSAKILTVVKNGGSRILGVVKSLWDKIQDVVKKLVDKTWDATKPAGRAVKAHPYKTIVAVIASIAVVAGIVAFAGGNFPAITAKLPAFESFNAKIMEMIGKIKNPFTKVNATMVGGKLKVGFEAVKGATASKVASATAKVSGWSQTATKVASGQLSRAVSATKDGWGALVERGGKLAGSVFASAKQAAGAATEVGKAGGMKTAQLAAQYGASRKVAEFAGGMAMGAFMGSLVSMVIGLVKISYAIIVGGLKLIASTFRALLGVTESEPAVA